MSFSKTVQAAKAALDKAQAEVRRVSDAIDIHETKLEGLKAGLVSPPDRSDELAEVLAGLALGEVSQIDVEKLRKQIDAEAAQAAKKNAADHQRIAEMEQQLTGLRSRLVKAEAAEVQAQRDLHTAALNDVNARVEADGAKLLEHLKALAEIMPRLLSDAMLADQVDRLGRFDGIVRGINADVTDWPGFLPGTLTAEQAYLLTAHAHRSKAARLLEDELIKLADAGINWRDLKEV